jgi:hypothetical protein
MEQRTNGLVRGRPYTLAASAKLAGMLALALAPAPLVLSSCAYDVDDQKSSEEPIGRVSLALGRVHLNTSAAEISVSNTNNTDLTMTATFNADDPQFITFNNNGRQTRRLASLMGFTRYDILNNVVKNTGRVRPPAEWSAIWGDPSITRNRADPNIMYISNLAIPTNKFPDDPNLPFSQDFIEGAVNPAGLPANYCGAYLGGGCIARSTNSGQSFSLPTASCVRRISTACPFGSFYDGSDLETSPEGRVYAAFNDVFRSKIDVYMATTPTGAFSRITDPPGFSSLHPRIKYGPGGLYLMVQDGSSLKLMRYGGGSSFTGTWTTPVTVTTGITVADVVLSDRRLRLGPQFDLDIGLKEGSNEVQLRTAYTVLDANGKHRVRASRCTTGATITCTQPGAWRTDSAAGEQWGPAIAAGFRFTGGAQYWGLSWYDRRNSASGNQVEMWRGVAAITTTGSSSFTQTRQETAQVPCPDSRGYWGDYDDMAAGYFGSVFRGFTDSTHGTCSRAQYHATPQYASLLLFTCGSGPC